MGTTVGVILAGGMGTRLRPATELLNKHTVPVGKALMVDYPLHTLLSNGIHHIIIVSGGEHIGSLMTYLGSGSRYHASFTFKSQDAAGGIAQALGRVSDCVDERDTMAVVLGDNVFESAPLDDVRLGRQHGYDAHIFLKRVEDPRRFGVADLREGKLTAIIEKPADPPTKLAVTGLYCYTSEVWNAIAACKPSKRGELEITDVNNWFLQRGRLRYSILDGFWSDAGTWESRAEVEAWLRQHPAFEAQVATNRRPA